MILQMDESYEPLATEERTVYGLQLQVRPLRKFLSIPSYHQFRRKSCYLASSHVISHMRLLTQIVMVMRIWWRIIASNDQTTSR